MQTVSTQFDQLSKGEVRPISYGLGISFDKQFDEDVIFFKLDQSILDGPDILSPSDGNPLQEWDKYRYLNFADRSMGLEVSREIDFPFSVSAAVADFQLNNFDDLFTPNSGSSISPYVLPARPLRIFMGFNGSNLQQFVGLTEFMPTIDGSSRTVSFHAVDFLSKLFTLKIPNILAMQNVTTDEVLDALFQSAGLLPTQYSLAKGRNKIFFVHYEKGTTMGYIINNLMQAEMGQLWMDEAGVIRFTPRIYNTSAPVYVFDDSNIIDIKTTNSGRIINLVEINATIRQVQTSQPIFTAYDNADDGYVIAASSSKDIFSNLVDPVIEVTTPAAGVSTNSSYFIATDLDGNPVGSVTVASEALFVDSYRVTFNNANAFPVRISELVIWGEPAKIVDTIKYVEKDQVSIDKYEEHSITLDNDFVQSIDACESIALSLLDSYSEFSGDIELTVKGSPALQIGDYIEVSKDTYTGDYRITKIINRIIDGKFEQILGARRFVDRTYFVLDQSVLNGTDVLAP